MLDHETIEFLERPLLMRLATLGADGYPQVTPVWFVQENGYLYTSTDTDRVKYRNMVRNARIGAAIDDDARPYRGLSIKGVARLNDQDARARVRRIAGRYVRPDELDALMEWLFKGARIVIEIEPVSIVKMGAGWHGE